MESKSEEKANSPEEKPAENRNAEPSVRENVNKGLRTAAEKTKLYTREKWAGFLAWRTGLLNRASLLPYTKASILLAAAAYTRGLWTPFFLARRIFNGPFRHRPVEWRMPEELVRLHLQLALVYAIPWTVAELFLFWIFYQNSGTICYLSGFLFTMAVLLQWLVYPWVAIRSVVGDENVKFQKNSELERNPVTTAITEEKEGQIADFGFLLRDATFGVDSEKRRNEDDTKPSAPPEPEEFFGRIEESLKNEDDITTERVVVVGSEQAQPDEEFDLESPSNETDLGKTDTHRLCVFAQHPIVDGLSTVELNFHQVKSHLAFNIRIRWLPELKPRLQRLIYLPKERRWWRLVLLPILLVTVLLIQASLVESYANSRKTALNRVESKRMKLAEETVSEDQSAAIETLRELAQQGNQPAREALSKIQSLIERVKAGEVGEQKADEEFIDLLSQGLLAAGAFGEEDFEPFARLWIIAVESRSTMVFVTWIAAAFSFTPLILFLGLLLLRGFRYLRGAVCASAQINFNVSPISNLRYAYSRLDVVENDSLLWSVSYVQMIEEIVTNRIITVLQEHDIDTTSIKQEMNTFVNEGIYMTGGRLSAANIAVGRRSFIKRIVKSSKSTRGQVALVGSTTKP